MNKTIELKKGKTEEGRIAYFAKYSTSPESALGWIQTPFLRAYPIQKMIDELAKLNPGYVIQVM